MNTDNCTATQPGPRSEFGPTIVTFYHEYDQNGYLSNWYESPFVVFGYGFRTAEHWMMWQKARMFGDFGKADEILDAKTPKDAKALGKDVKPYDDDKWAVCREQLFLCGLRHKFVQNEPLRDKLLSTGSAILAEAAPRDRIWGIGKGQNDPDINDPATWRGLNLLGRALMTVRSDLRMLERQDGDMDWQKVELERLQVWDMTLLELSRIPLTRRAALAYAKIVSTNLPDMFPDVKRVLDQLRMPASDIDEMIGINMGGGLPIAGWHELLDELRFHTALGRLQRAESTPKRPSMVVCQVYRLTMKTPGD